MQSQDLNTRLNICVLYDRRGRPLAAGVAEGGATRAYPLYARGSGSTIRQVEDRCAEIAGLVNDAVAAGDAVVTSSFKTMLESFDVQLVRGVSYPVYDLCWNTSVGEETQSAAAVAAASGAVDRMASAGVSDWQRVFANAAVVYQSMQDRGVTIGGVAAQPLWSQQTYSGRSKTMGINVQGADGNELLGNVGMAPDDLFLHFDWVAADMRVASLMSGDELLLKSFEESDPYTAMTDMLTDDGGTIDREVCKLRLLSAVNSFDFTAAPLAYIYRGLGTWLAGLKERLSHDGYLESIMGRRFRVGGERNEYAALNGLFQGSVAHAMQSAIKRIWDTYGDALLVEMHDSVVVTCRQEFASSVVREVSEMMVRPFGDALDSNPFFPVRISVGRKFRDWRPIRVLRESGVQKL